MPQARRYRRAPRDRARWRGSAGAILRADLPAGCSDANRVEVELKGEERVGRRKTARVEQRRGDLADRADIRRPPRGDAPRPFGPAPCTAPSAGSDLERHTQAAHAERLRPPLSRHRNRRGAAAADQWTSLAAPHQTPATPRVSPASVKRIAGLEQPDVRALAAPIVRRGVDEARQERRPEHGVDFSDSGLAIAVTAPVARTAPPRRRR